MQQKGEANGFLSMSCFSNKEYKSHVTGCCASWALLVYVQVEEQMEKYANFGRAYCCQSSLITKTKAVWEIPQAPLCKTPRWEQPASRAIHTCKHAGIDAFFFFVSSQKSGKQHRRLAALEKHVLNAEHLGRNAALVSCEISSSEPAPCSFVSI